MKRNPPNVIVVEGEIAKVQIKNKAGKVIAEAIIDRSDNEKVAKWTWHYKETNRHNGKGYAIRSYDKLRLHWFILGGKPNGRVADHINRNSLDNRKSNLRITDLIHNARNRSPRANSKTGIVGVRLDTKHGPRPKWIAHIVADDGKAHTQTFQTKEEAVEARTKMETMYWKEVREAARALREENKKED